MTTTSPRRRRSAFASLAAAAALALGATGPAAAQEGPPEDTGNGDNRGTVKVNDVDLTGPANVPHVECIFDVAFFGFHDGAVADITFSVHPPTTDPVDPETSPATSLARADVQLGEAVPQPEAQHVETFDLTDFVAPFEPHDQQGHHVKLAVDVHGTPGGLKQKVFWVDCPAPEEPNGEVPNGEEGNGEIPNGNGPAEVEDVVIVPEQETVVEERVTEEVRGVAVEQPVPAAAEAPRAELPRTGVEWSLALIGLGLLTAGVGGVLLGPGRPTRTEV